MGLGQDLREPLWLWVRGREDLFTELALEPRPQGVMERPTGPHGGAVLLGTGDEAEDVKVETIWDSWGISHP